MDTFSRVMKGWVSLAALLISGLAQAALVEGRDYVRLPSPQPTLSSPDKVIVTEFFSYGCPACYQLHRPIKQWSAALPPSIEFKRQAVWVGHDSWQPLAQLFYGLSASGDLPKVDDAVFDAIHLQRTPLHDERKLTAWLQSRGVDAKRVMAMYKSFAVGSEVNRADALAKQMRLPGVPSIVVDGRYLVVGKQARTHSDLLNIATELARKAASEK